MDFIGSLAELFVLNIITKDDYINNKVKCLLVTKMEIHVSNITENSMEWTRRKKSIATKSHSVVPHYSNNVLQLILGKLNKIDK